MSHEIPAKNDSLEVAEIIGHCGFCLGDFIKGLIQLLILKLVKALAYNLEEF